jgi:hypothetical protein
VEDRVESDLPVENQEGQGKKQGPEGRDLPEVVVPEVGDEQGAQGDGEENPRKGQNRPHGQDSPDMVCRLVQAAGGQTGRRFREEQKQRGRQCHQDR